MKKIANYQVIIFDWDGTLIDSSVFITQCVQAAAMDLELVAPSPEFIISKIGLPLSKQIAYYFPELDEKYHESFTKRYREYAVILPEKSKLFPHVSDVLKKLTEQLKFKIALATSKTRAGLTADLERCGLSDFFSAIRCGDEVPPKPHPQMILEILSELNVAPEHALMIGDTEYDLQMAVNSGVSSIGVGYGVRSKAQLLAYQPVAIIDSIEQLLDHVN